MPKCHVVINHIVIRFNLYYISYMYIESKNNPKDQKLMDAAVTKKSFSAREGQPKRCVGFLYKKNRKFIKNSFNRQIIHL